MFLSLSSTSFSVLKKRINRRVKLSIACLLYRSPRGRSGTPNVNVIGRCTLRRARQESIVNRLFLRGSHVLVIVVKIVIVVVILILDRRFARGRSISNTIIRVAATALCTASVKSRDANIVVLGSLDGDVLRSLRSSQALHFRNFVQSFELCSSWSVRETGARRWSFPVSRFAGLTIQNTLVEGAAYRSRGSAFDGRVCRVIGAVILK